MKENKLTNRRDKIEFLKGLQNKTRSLEEIIELQGSHLTYMETDGVVVIKDKDDNIISREEAKKIRSRTSQDVMIFVKGKSGGLAHQAFEEDRGTNPKIGRHLCFIPAAFVIED